MSDVMLRNTPVQDRGRAKVELIENAAREILAEVGRDRITTGMVAHRAGVSIGTVYRYFVDRVAILDAIAPNRDPRIIDLGIDITNEIAALPEGSVLLCAVGEVFWLPPEQLDRRWLAAGYDPAVYSWTDEQVAEWAPLTVLHVGPTTGAETGSNPA